jgi:trk system potassium uptake protein TrkH
MNGRSVLSYAGVVLEANGVLLLLPVLATWMLRESVYLPFLFAAVLSFIPGIILDRRFKKGPLTFGPVMMLAALCFILVSIIGSIPYMDYLGPVDALFESFSGFTTTGLTILSPETLPNTMLFWRALTQWVGGFSIILVFLMLVQSPGISPSYIYKSESGSGRIDQSFWRSARRMFAIYGAFTLAGFLLLAMAGMPIFDSIAHSFTAISTGGFSVKNSSIAFYSSPAIETVIIILMILGATSFFLHDKLSRKEFGEYLRNGENRMFWTFAAVFSILLSLSLISTNEPLRYGVFHTFSALTTGGFTNLSGGFTETAKMLIIILMVVGGFAGSCAGGIKLVRFGILSKAIPWLSKKVTYPSTAVLPFRFSGRSIKQEEVTIISLFSFLYLIILVVSALAISLMGYTPLDSIMTTAAAEGNSALTSIPLAAMPDPGKAVLIVCMLLGRLEILPFMVIIYYFVKGVGRRKIN